MGSPLETGLATCMVAVGLASRLGLDDTLAGRVHNLALLQHIGCTAVADEVAAVMGDELVMRSHASTLDFADKREMARFGVCACWRQQVTAQPVAIAPLWVPPMAAKAAQGCENGRTRRREDARHRP